MWLKRRCLLGFLSNDAISLRRPFISLLIYDVKTHCGPWACEGISGRVNHGVLVCIWLTIIPTIFFSRWAVFKLKCTEKVNGSNALMPLTSLLRTWILSPANAQYLYVVLLPRLMRVRHNDSSLFNSKKSKFSAFIEVDWLVFISSLSLLTYMCVFMALQQMTHSLIVRV